jgi:L-alanine-DL-glutamate epimerase-like enolase superfamily enzyme
MKRLVIHWILKDRLIPRLLEADPDHLVGEDGYLDPHRAWDVMMTNEKPGGHGERSVAVGVLDMALWDACAKMQGVPLYQLLANRAGRKPDSKVWVYAAGGYYYPGKDITGLQDEFRQYLDLGYTQPTADGNWGGREGRSRRAKALLRVDDKK